MTEIKRYRARSSGEIAWDQDKPLDDPKARMDRIMHGVPVIVEHPSGDMVPFADHEQALAAERERVRTEEVKPLMDALRTLVAGSGLYDVASIAYPAITAVEAKQKERT